MIQRLALLVLLFASTLAQAEPFLVESASHTDQASAVALGSGVALGRSGGELSVVRRFERGAGWGFVVQVKNIDDLDQARKIASQLGSLGGPARVYDVEGRERVLVEVGADASPPPDLPAPGVDAHAEVPDSPAHADAILRAAARAHGGRKGGLALLDASTGVDISYERTVHGADGALVAHHRLVRYGPAMRLEVTIREGDGVDSVTILTPQGEAWIVVDGKATARDATRAREVLERFSPEQILAVPLGLPDDIDTARAWRNLAVASAEDDAIVLRPEKKERRGLTEAGFDAETSLLRYLEWDTDQGPMRYRFDDYREVTRHLLVPFAVRIERDGEIIESLQVGEMTVDPVVDPALFERPESADD